MDASGIHVGKDLESLTSAVDETVVPTPGGRLQLAAPSRL